MSDLSLDVYVSPMVDLPAGGQFSPTSATLILGDTEAILVDTPYMQDSLDEVIKRIEQSGRRLTTILVTHGHFDHYFGLSELLERFPDARALASDAVAASIAASLEQDRKQVEQFFSGAGLDNTAAPSAPGDEVLAVDGEEVRLIDIEQADINPASIVHIPSLAAVIAGDAVYNGINPMLAATTPEQWQAWLRSINAVEALDPQIVIAGHKQPGLPDDDLSATVGATRAYIEEFASAVDQYDSSRELTKHMQERYPDYGNPSALIMSAATAMKRKKG